jgi:hypothetical protein
MWFLTNLSKDTITLAKFAVLVVLNWKGRLSTVEPLTKFHFAEKVKQLPLLESCITKQVGAINVLSLPL